MGGTYLGDFVTGLPGGGEARALAWDANGDLYVSPWSGTVRKYDGVTGAPILGYNTTPFPNSRRMLFDENGNFVRIVSNVVQRYLPDGTFLDGDSSTGEGFRTVAVAPDGIYYLGSEGTTGVYRYNSNTGLFMDGGAPWAGGNTQLNGLVGNIVLGPDGDLYMSTAFGGVNASWIERIYISNGQLQGTQNANEGYWGPLSNDNPQGMVLTPEPASLALVGLGGLLMLRRKR